MNRKLISALALILCTLMLFSSCTEDTAEETTFETITEGEIEKQTENNIIPEIQETTTEQEPSQEETTEKEKEIIGTVTGYTSKGFVISVKDSITYVDGVLVANKTYSLPESYNPGTLLSDCEKAFAEMKSEAGKLGYNLWNASGFRSYELQESLYTRYCDRDGKAAADRYSARPGHSEHQSGLALDLNEISSSFADTDEGRWVEENCHKFGFILRYPKGKEAQTGYMYEPWHIRYVGVDTATAIYNSGLCLEEYYGITSVYAPEEEPEESSAVMEETTEALPEIIPEETSSASEVTTEITETTEAVNVG